MLDYTVQAYILCMINANNNYMLYMIILVYTTLHKSIIFMRCYITRAFSLCCSKYTFLFDDCILLVYYCKIYSI